MGSSTTHSHRGALTVTPDQLSFPETLVHEVSAGQTVTLKNTGWADIVIQSMTINGDFSFNPPTFPFVIKSNAALILTVDFRPDSEGNPSGLIEIDTGKDGKYYIELRGSSVFGAGSQAVVFDDSADLSTAAGLAYPDGAYAVVPNDPTSTANNGYYKKVGAAGSGSWTGPLAGFQGTQGPAGNDGADGAQGIQGTQGPPGNDGADGAQGIQGIPGLDGRTVLNGTVAPPAGIGDDGDFYINTATWEIYGPKTTGVWGSASSLIGATGPQGIPGNDGLDGSQGVPGNDGTDGAPGADGITAVLSNESHVTAADNDGTNYSLVNSDGIFKVYEGGVDVTTSATFSILGGTDTGTHWEITQNGLKISINKTSGLYTLSGAAWTTNQEIFELRANYGGVTFIKDYTITKSIQGSQGIPGTDGVDGIAGADGKWVEFVWQRAAAQPAAPSGNGIPAGWSDDPPAGADPLWMSQVEQELDGTLVAGKSWSTPIQHNGPPGADGAPGSDGADAVNSRYPTIYRLNNNTISLTAGTFADPLFGNSAWSYSVPALAADGDIVYASSRILTSDGLAPQESQWSSPVIYAQRVDGTDGSSGSAGQTIRQVNIYRLNSSSINAASGTFADPLANNVSWSYSVPAVAADGDTIYVSTRTFTDDGLTPQDLAWSTPVIFGQRVDGAPGADGNAGSDGNSVYFAQQFQRAASQPSTPTGGSYNFGTKTLAPSTGWSATPPASDGNPLWVTTATAEAPPGGTDNTLTWGTPATLVSDGVDGNDGSNGAPGSDGSDGASVYFIQIFLRSASAPATPTGGSYNFATQTLTPPAGGWTTTHPASDGNPLYVATAIAEAVVGGTDSTLTWTTPQNLVSDGIDGAAGPPGNDGNDGADGPTYTLEKSQPNFIFVNGVLNPASQTITFTAFQDGVSVNADWTTLPNVKSATGSSTFTINNTEMGANKYTVVTATINGVKLFEYISLWGDYLATIGAISGGNLLREDEITVFHDVDIRTLEGVAASIVGQGVLATQNNVDLATSEVTNKSLLNLDSLAERNLYEALTAAPLLPWTFAEDGRFFMESYAGDPDTRTPIGSGNATFTFQNDATYGRVAQTISTAGTRDLSTIGVIKVQAGRKYRASGAFKTLAGTRSCVLYLLGLDATYTYNNTPGESIGFTANTTWQVQERILDGDTLLASGVEYVRCLCRANAGTEGVQFGFCRIEDVTFAWDGVTGVNAPDDNADVTAANVAASVTGQGALATQNDVDWGTDVANKPEVSTYVNNLLSIEEWTVGKGSGGNSEWVGTDFGVYSSGISNSSNVITLTDGPGGYLVPVWLSTCTVDQSPSGSWAGGFLHNLLNSEGKLDSKKSYRYVCWIRRSDITRPFYLGWESNRVSNLGVGDTPNSNPYSFPNSNPPAADKWYLQVAVIWGEDYDGADTGIAGYYDPDTGEKVKDGVEFKHAAGVTDNFIRHSMYRAALNDTTEFYAPRWDELNGNEPTIAALIGAATGPVEWADILDGAGTKPDDNADVTSANTAAAISGQGSLATQNNVTGAQVNVAALDEVATNLGTFSSAAAPNARTVIGDDVILVYDASNNLRVKIGNLA